MRTRLACLAAVTALAAACGGSASAAPDQPAAPPTVNARTDMQNDLRTSPSAYEVNVKLSDGRVVVCVVAYSPGFTPLGMSCDWTAK